MKSMMNNPFQVQNRPIPAAMQSSKSSFTLPGKLGLLSAAITLAIALLWLSQQGDWLPDPLRRLIPPSPMSSSLFVAQADMNREQARALYQQALNNLQNSEFDAALSVFKQLEPAFPGLKDMLWLHQAECYAGQGNEWAVQKKLNALIEQIPGSPLKPLALYRIGQSQFRGGEWDKATQTFHKVRADHPKSNYAMGSLYYLGARLAQSDTEKSQAIAPLKDYLTQCPDCKFSSEAAELLDKLLPSPTPEEHALLGLASSAQAKTLQKTLSHLEKGPRPLTWLTLGKLQIQARKVTEGVHTLRQGLVANTDPDKAKDAIDTILAHLPDADQQKAFLNQARTQSLQSGGDYILWKLAELAPEQSEPLYKALATQYPESSYAPESGWRVLWPLVVQGQSASYLSQASQYLTHYGYARSAPKVLFWMGKLQEKNNPIAATQAYLRLREQYPATYYAFRANGRLKVLTEGKPDPGWPTDARRGNYPPRVSTMNALDVLPPADTFGLGSSGQHVRDAIRELQVIGAAEDASLLANEALGYLPPALESWADQVRGDRAKGIRVLRDALEKQAKEAFQTSSNRQMKAIGTMDELKLLYPIYFEPNIQQFSRQNSLDPFLVQALMREESYFNEFAVSGSNARGLMQLLPSTAGEVAEWEHISHFKTNDLFSPATNIQLGSRYLAHLHELFNGNSMPAVGAYNGGPGAMRRWVQTSPFFASDPDMFVERIPYEQSRDYIKKVFASYWNYQRLYTR